MPTIELLSKSTPETIHWGWRIGRQLRGGEVFAVCGPLGTGKTHLIKGIAQGLGYEQGVQVNSPTFALVNEYSGRLLIYHIDAYRLDSVREFEMLGFTDLLHPDAVVLIEWADKILSCLEGIETIRIDLEYAGSHQRRIRIEQAPCFLGALTQP